MTSFIGSDPILDCAAAGAFELARFDGDEAKEWAAMQSAGLKVGQELVRDCALAGIDPDQAERVLVLVGKGHNGGDALLAACHLLDETRWRIDVGFVFGQNRLRPLALRAWQQLQQHAEGNRVAAVRRQVAEAVAYTVVLDGVFGFQFRPPLTEPAVAWLQAGQQVAQPRLRAAVDLPSGLGESGSFVADVSYATGIFKSPLLALPQAGRLRYLDLGFFDGDTAGNERVVTPAILAPLRRLRDVQSDKRSFGQLAVVGGSRSYPGAIAMTVAAALHSGVGNVAAFVPASIGPAMAAKWPEAMWMGCPETEDGNLAIDAGIVIQTHLPRASALVAGPGLGREPETHAMLAETLGQCRIPVLLDADALQPELVQHLPEVSVLTPHAGEWERIQDSVAGSIVVRKGPITTVTHEAARYHVVEAGPELARGGSGDMLAGLIGGRLAAASAEPLLATLQGTYWHAQAALRMARRWGETAVRNTALLDELNGALRS